MNRMIVTISLVLIQIISKAQVVPCNRSAVAKQYEKILPKEVCIPRGYVVAAVYEETDVDGDGLMDFIFDWQKPEMQDGDSSFLCIYRRTSDSTHVLLKNFSNLFPIYFKNYSMSYKPHNKKLLDLYFKYGYKDPLVDFQIKGKEIIIKLENATGEGNILYYKYDMAFGTWKMIKLDYWISGYAGKIRIEPRSLPRTKLLIEEFDYLDYMY